MSIVNGARTDVFLDSLPQTKEKIINFYVQITQFLIWPLLYLCSVVLYNTTISGKENLKKIDGPFLLISNHFSCTDSFLLRIILGPFTPHLPLRFMGVDKYDWSVLNFLAKIGFIKVIYTIFGVFTISPGEGVSRNLRRASDILKAGGNVVIFPEGKIISGGGIAPFKRGAAVLAQEARVPVLPISFSVVQKKLLRTSLRVNIGAPLSITPVMSIDEARFFLHEQVDKLYRGTPKT